MSSRTTEPFFTLVVVWVLLVPLLYFVARGQFSFDRTSYNTTQSHDGGQLTDNKADANYFRMQQLVIYGTAFAVMFPLLSASLALLRRNKSILLLPLFALLSLVWSQDPLKTLICSSTIMIVTAFGAYLLHRFSPERLMKLLLLLGGVTVALCYAAVFLVPSAGIEHLNTDGAWQGMFTHKNCCAIVLTFLITAVFCKRPKTGPEKLVSLFSVIAALVLVIESQSRTGWLLLASAFLFSRLIRFIHNVASHEKTILLISAATIGSAIGFCLVAYAPEMALLLGKTSTLTGRTGIWSAISAELWKRPVEGFGYNAFWTGMKGESANLVMSTGYKALSNAENAVLQIWLELGLIGVTLMFVTLAISSRNAIRCLLHRSSEYTDWCVMIVFLTLMTLIDGDKIMFPHTIQWLFYVMAHVSLAEEARRSRKEQKHEPATSRLARAA